METATPKKQYHAPSVERFGTLTDLTAGGSSGNLENKTTGPGPNLMRQVRP